MELQLFHAFIILYLILYNTKLTACILSASTYFNDTMEIVRNFDYRSYKSLWLRVSWKYLNDMLNCKTTQLCSICFT